MKINIDRSRHLQIFDLGGVLVDVDARQTLLALQNLGMPPFEGPISNSHAAGGCFSLYCDGLISTPDFLAEVRGSFCHNATDEQISAAWNAMIGNFRPDAIKLVQSLRAEGYQTALLSNCNELHTDLCRQICPELDSLFDALFFSQEIHVSKPDPRAWFTVLTHFGVAPSQAAFYDDSETNTLAATSIGISAVQVL